MEQMDCKPYQPLSKARHELELAYTSSSEDSDDGRNPRKSYTSRETLPDYGQELRLNYNSHSKIRSAGDGPTQEVDFCETPQMMCPSYQVELRSAPLRGYPLAMGSDVDTETEGGPSPDQALRLWMREIKSEHSSCLSSRANSVLSLTDTEQERKSDGENGSCLMRGGIGCAASPLAVSSRMQNGDNGQSARTRRRRGGNEHLAAAAERAQPLGGGHISKDNAIYIQLSASY
ncbi:hypothetical protein AAFF_G00311530 [Aldrovandia affinis]|uniref:Teneurin N-terminal domain-containing protein n=1 Tax=Aldrovandia affinis TaxID=143900 RepID=A0AAD7WQI3_9TELE|nr:hypothetical protein AAFF_G00311530 [Aldrovandia affinis]